MLHLMLFVIIVMKSYFLKKLVKIFQLAKSNFLQLMIVRSEECKKLPVNPNNRIKLENEKGDMQSTISHKSTNDILNVFQLPPLSTDKIDEDNSLFSIPSITPQSLSLKNRNKVDLSENKLKIKKEGIIQ